MFQRYAVTRQEVYQFAKAWPGFNLPYEEIIFEFQWRSSGLLGDLLDVQYNQGDIDENTERALSAMADDVRNGKLGQEVR